VHVQCRLRVWEIGDKFVLFNAIRTKGITYSHYYINLSCQEMKNKIKIEKLSFSLSAYKKNPNSKLKYCEKVFISHNH